MAVSSLSRLCRAYGLVLLAVFLVGLLTGCAASGNDGPAAEMALQDPPSYGIVSNVAPAVMAGREIRRGDIAITVDLEDGRIVTVVQPEDNTYVVGDRVRVVRDGERFSRVQLY